MLSLILPVINVAVSHNGFLCDALRVHVQTEGLETFMGWPNQEDWVQDLFWERYFPLLRTLY